MNRLCPPTETPPINLYEFPNLLREIESDTILECHDHRCISRDPLNDNERLVLTEILDFILNKMNDEQRHVFNKIFQDTNKNKYTTLDTNTESLVKVPISILNAPAGTGKTMVILAYQIKVNLDFGYKNGAIIYTPSYASLHAVEVKITEILIEINKNVHDDDVDRKSMIASQCLSINILNQFYACGPQSFNIHDKSVCAKVIERIHKIKLNNESQVYKINNVQAIRECRAIIVDEAFFSTSNRCYSFIDMLTQGYIDHPYLNKELRTSFSKLLDRLVFMKKIVFAGDPYQLSVSVEQKAPGVQKHLIDQGDPMWDLRNKLRDCVRLSDHIDDPTQYQLLTLKTNHRFENVPESLANAILDIRCVIYKGEENHDQYVNQMIHLLTCMDEHKMIEYTRNHEDVAHCIEREDKHTMYALSEIHKTSEMINEVLLEKNINKFVPYIHVSAEFIFGEKKEGIIQWIPYGDYIKKFDSNDLQDFENRYKEECKNGSIANKFIGPKFPNEENKTKHKLFIGDKVRVSIPLKKKHEITRILNDSVDILPDDFNIPTGTFGQVVHFEGRTVYIEICNEEDANNFIKKMNTKRQHVKLSNGFESDNPIFAIKHSEELNDPYFKSAFCDYILPEKSFNSAVHSYPFKKESASTIHSLQGKSISKNEKIIYYMHTIRKESLDGVYCNDVGQWKGCLPNLLYVALTRSRVPHLNFKLMTGAKNRNDLLKKLTCGKRPRSYNDLKTFNSSFEKYINES